MALPLLPITTYLLFPCTIPTHCVLLSCPVVVSVITVTSPLLVFRIVCCFGLAEVFVRPKDLEVKQRQKADTSRSANIPLRGGRQRRLHAWIAVVEGRKE